jgi:hypothetical protein
MGRRLADLPRLDLFSAPSASLQRDFNPGGDICWHRMTNKGGSVVPPRPTTTRGGFGATSARAGASIEKRALVVVCDGGPRRVHSPLFGSNDCVAIVTTRKR